MIFVLILDTVFALIFLVPVPVRIWSEIWRFIYQAYGLFVGYHFSVFFMLDAKGLVFYFFSYGGWLGNLAHCDFWLCSYM